MTSSKQLSHNDIRLLIKEREARERARHEEYEATREKALAKRKSALGRFVTGMMVDRRHRRDYRLHDSIEDSILEVATATPVDHMGFSSAFDTEVHAATTPVGDTIVGTGTELIVQTGLQYIDRKSPDTALDGAKMVSIEDLSARELVEFEKKLGHTAEQSDRTKYDLAA